MVARPENWNLLPPPGFQGLRDDLPLKVYGQVLPHWRQDGATYFLTFRLKDSLPQAKLRELRELKTDWERKYAAGHGGKSTPQRREMLALELMRHVETWLDQGMGSCCLRSSEVSCMLRQAIHATDGTRCELGCYVVMPNHVHAVIRPLHPVLDPIEKILQTWKGSSALLINALRGESGTLWQRDSFDRIVRDEQHLWRIVQYIGSNPAKAGLSARETFLWIRPEWVELGWGFGEGAGVD